MTFAAGGSTFIIFISTIFVCIYGLSIQGQPNANMIVEIVQMDGQNHSGDYYFHQDLTARQLQELRGLNKKAVTNITCPELNNFTFTNEPPFDILGNPECGNKVEPEMMLYLYDTNHTQCQLNPDLLPNNQTTQCLNLLRDKPDNKKVVILIHGFLNNFDTTWLHEMKDAIQFTDPGSAVIIVGWGRGLVDIFSYWRAAANTRYISQALFFIMEALHEVVGRQVFTHCAGHSLGGHVCGFVGKHLKSSSVPPFDRISAMDPAGPLFCNDVPYPFNHLNVTSASRLNHTDANFVDVIHTDGDARYLGYIPQYGTLEALGTIDFYPGHNGEYGEYQPGCYDVFDVVSCSHSRAHMLYRASIDQADCLASRVCMGDPHKIPKNCHTLRNDTTHHNQDLVTMGYWWNTSNPQPGCYTVEVGSASPYCL